MVKLKAGKGKKGRGKKSTKKPKTIEEITLSSDEEQEEVMMDGSSGAENSDEEMMDVVENGKENGKFSDSDVELKEKNGQEIGTNNDSLNENGIGTSTTSENIEKSDDKPLEKNGDDSQTNENDCINEKQHEDTHVQTQPVVISLAKNGVEPQPEEAGSNTNPFQVSIIPKPPELPKHPELRPGHVWRRKESKEIFKHLVPRVALIKLKHDKKYIRNLQPNQGLSSEEEELNYLLDRTKTNMVMELSGGVSAIIESDGSSTLLPPNYKDLIEVRRRKAMRWKQESAWLPPKLGAGRKLNLANVKLGPSIKQPRLKLDRIDVKKEIQKMKNQEKNKRRQAAKKAQQLLNMSSSQLLQQQHLLQQQRSQMVSDPYRSGTPIVRNGKVVGYAVNADSKAKKLPGSIVVPSGGMMGITDNDFPELEDYSILEPEVILEEKDEIIPLFDSPVRPTQPGARQVLVNGKLLTLVPFQGAPGSAGGPPMTSSLPHHGYYGMGKQPVGKLPLPRAPIVVHPNHPRLNMNSRPSPSPLRIPFMQKSHLKQPPLLPVNHDEVECDFCSVKLPRSILHMHMKMRHLDLIQQKSKPADNENSEMIQCTPEILLDSDAKDNSEKNDTNVTNSKQDLIELNPSSNLETEVEQDPLADPLAI